MISQRKSSGTSQMPIARLSLFALLVSSLLYPSPSIGSDQIPGKPQSKPIAIINATIYPVASQPIEGGTILFNDGLIVEVGEVVELPSDCEVIDGQGKHVYPSLIEAYSNLGLVEINSVRATLDSREVGTFNPNVRAAAAFNPDSEIIPVNRANGILLSVTAPSGGRISGRSSLMMLDGWTWEEMTLKPDTGLHLRMPTDEEDLEALALFIDQAKRYHAQDPESRTKDLRLEAMIPVLERQVPVIAQADSINAIEAAVAFSIRHQLRLIVLGGADAVHCAELLKQHEIPVILSGVYRNPRRRHAAYDGPYALPSKLHQLGLEFCIATGGQFGATGARNLPYHAGTAVAYGLDESAALKAITAAPAKILGVEDRVGRLVPGLDATLFVADGNILETPTQVELAFIQGRRVDLSSKHTQLYHKYSERLDRNR